jgi:hypothetical protein
MKNQILVVGQKVHCTLYGGKDGFITSIEGEQKPESVKSLLGGVGVTGGNAHINIAFHDHFSNVPESLVRGSVQWSIYDTVISSDLLNAKIQQTQACIDSRKELADNAENAKQAEELRQHTAPEYAYLKPCEKYDTTATAKNIRLHLKKMYPSVKFSVRKEHHSSIGVTWTDGPFKADIEETLSNFKNISGYRVDDSTEYSKHAWIFGVVDYLHVSRDHSDTSLQDAIGKINAKFKVEGTVEMFKNGRFPPLGESFNYDSYDRELYDVLEGRKDYDLEAKQWDRRKEVESVLKETYGVTEFRSDTVYAWEHEGEWIVTTGGYCEHEFRYKDDFSLTPESLACMLNIEINRITPIVMAEREAREAEEKHYAQEITPISVSYEHRSIMVTFPACNKQHVMEDNDAAIEESPEPSQCQVEKTITLSNEQFDLVSNSLLNDRPKLWEKIGGSFIDDRHLADIVEGTPLYYEAWRKRGITRVVEVLNEIGSDSFYVNCEGYGCARYTGRSAEHIAKIATSKIMSRLGSNLVH